MRSSPDALTAVADATVLLAAHGSASDASVCESIRRLGDRLRQAGFERVAVGFHRGEPSFSSSLDPFTPGDLVVVPVMTSCGYYSDVVLPREIARRRDALQWRVRYSEPLGAHPRLAAIVLRHLTKLKRRASLHRFAVAVVGHGTRRHARSRETALVLASALGSVQGCVEARAFFLDDEPPVEEVAAWRSRTDLVVVPFFVAAGRHATHDLDRRLGVEGGEGERPSEHLVGDRRLIVDRTIGDYEEIPSLIAELAATSRSATAES